MKYIVYLLTIVLPVKQRTVTILADVRVSGFSRTAHQYTGCAKRSNCWSAKPHLSGPDLWSPNSHDLSPVDYNSGSIRQRSRMWMNPRSDWLKSGLFSSRRLLTLIIDINGRRNSLHACVRAKGQHFKHVQ